MKGCPSVIRDSGREMGDTYSGDQLERAVGAVADF